MSPTAQVVVEPNTAESSVSQLRMLRFGTSFDWMLLGVGLLMSCMAGCAAPVRMLFIGDWFDVAGASEANVGGKMPMDSTIRMVLSLVYIGCGLIVGRGVAETSLCYTRERQMFAYKKAYVRAVLRQDVAWFDANRSEQLATRMGESFATVHEGLTQPLSEPAEALVGLVFGWALAFWKSWEVALAILGVAPFIFLTVVALLKTNKSAVTRIQDAYAEAGALSFECLSHIRTVASLGLEETIAARYDKLLDAARHVAARSSFVAGLAGGILFVAPQIVICIGIVFGAYLLAGERIDSAFATNITDGALCQQSGVRPIATLTCSLAETLVAFNALTCAGIPGAAALRTYTQEHAPSAYLQTNPPYFGCLRTPGSVLIAMFSVMLGAGMLARMVNPLVAGARARRAASSINMIIDRTPPIDTYSDAGARPESVAGDVELREVRFAYPTALSHPILNGTSVRIDAGSVCALVGASGSGKSTIIALLERFYDPHSGTVLLDGVDTTTLNVRWLRSQLGLVSQEPVLFQGTVEQNIRYGRSGATREEVEAAARSANAHDFISSDLMSGYDTQVGQGGGKLSGGQKQRVAIARALVRQPSVLLLDEATSALDNESEKIVQAALDAIMAKQKRTTIVIAHRLSTIRDANQIVVLSKGAVVEQGTHDELLQMAGDYFALVEAQQRA